MAQNLNYQLNGSWCYDDNTSNCDIYGRLYDWNTATAGSYSYYERPHKVQGICPTGWHLPSREEWEDLVLFVDNSAKTLKSASGWKDTYTAFAGTDEYGFSALPGGYRWSSSYVGIGNSGYWWTATTEYPWYMKYDDTIVREGTYHNNSYGLSVRCVRDD